MRRCAALVLAIGLTGCTSNPASTLLPTVSQTIGTPTTIGTPSSPAMATSPPTPGPTVARATPSATTPPLSVAELDWGLITARDQPDLGDRESSAQMWAAASRGREVVGVGDVTGKGPAIWFSPDGHRWTRASNLPMHQDMSVLDVIAGDVGYVAVGSENGRAAAWSSADGRNWMPADVQGGIGVELARIARWGSGFVALGRGQWQESGPRVASVWHSDDGNHWEVLAPPGAIDQLGAPSAIIDGPAGLIMVGEFAEDAAAWSSSDGVTWTRAPGFEFGDGAGLRDVVMLNGILVAVGRRDVAASAPAAWISADGTTWRSAGQIGGLVPPAVLESVSLGGRGVVAVGNTSGGSVQVWTSSDGQDWIGISSLAWRGDPGEYHASEVVGGGPGLVIIGTAPRTDWLSGGTRSAAVWTNPPPPQTDMPEPTAAPCPSTDQPTLIEIIEVQPELRAECFAGRELTFPAYVVRWVEDDPPLSLETVPGGAAMNAWIDPGLPRRRWFRWFLITGRFEGEDFFVKQAEPTSGPH